LDLNSLRLRVSSQNLVLFLVGDFLYLNGVSGFQGNK
jgi:hypothetical protein